MKVYMFIFIGLIFVALVGYGVYASKLENKTIEKVVGISTIMTGIASIVVGGVSLYVMVSQKSTQELLLQIQKNEHQPTFAVNYHLIKDENSGTYNSEEFKIENIGERMKALTQLQVRSFVKVDYSHFDKNIYFTTYIPLSYYFNATVRTGNLQGVILYSVGSEYLKNNLKVSNLYMEAVEYSKEHEKEHVDISRIDLIKIAYIDIYNDENVQYMNKNQPIDETFYNQVMKVSQSNFSHLSYNLDELNMNLLWTDCEQLKNIRQ